MIKIKRLSIPVDFNLSFLKIRWSDHLLVEDSGKVIGEGVIYGGDWNKAEKLAWQMAGMKFGAKRNKLPVCEQLFISGNRKQKTENNEEIEDVYRFVNNYSYQETGNRKQKTMKKLKMSLNVGRI